MINVIYDKYITLILNFALWYLKLIYLLNINIIKFKSGSSNWLNSK